MNAAVESARPEVDDGPTREDLFGARLDEEGEVERDRLAGRAEVSSTVVDAVCGAEGVAVVGADDAGGATWRYNFDLNTSKKEDTKDLVSWWKGKEGSEARSNR